MSKKGSNSFWVVIVVIILFLLYVVSLGNASGKKITLVPDSFRDEKEEAKRKHKRLVDLIAKQEKLKAKLDKKFRRIYFGLRFGLTLIIGTIIFTLHLFRLIDDLGDFLNYVELTVLIILAFNFVTFGTVANLNDFVRMLKMRTENWVYGKYIDLDEKLNSNHEEKEKLAAVIEDK